MTTNPTTIMNATARTMRHRYVKRWLVTPCCGAVPAWGWSWSARRRDALICDISTHTRPARRAPVRLCGCRLRLECVYLWHGQTC